MDGSSRANQVVERVPDLAADFPMLEKSQNNSSGGVLGKLLSAALPSYYDISEIF